MSVRARADIVASADVPGAGLVSSTALASASLVLWNDLWLKRHHPGMVSGKLSDLGLCIFLPLFIAAVMECAVAFSWLVLARQRSQAASSARIDHLACVVAAVYFVAIKAWPLATQLHVDALSLLAPRWHFHAVTDPTDLLCLPAMAIAMLAMRRRRRH